MFLSSFLLLVYRQYNPLSPIDAIGEEKSKDQITYYLSGKGKTVVLFPSLGRTPSDFNDLVSFLNSKGYQTLAIAPRGFKNLSGTDKKDITLFMLGYIGYDVSLSITNTDFFKYLIKSYKYHYFQNNISSKLDNKTYELIFSHFMNLLLTSNKK